MIKKSKLKKYLYLSIQYYSTIIFNIVVSKENIVKRNYNTTWLLTIRTIQKRVYKWYNLLNGYICIYCELSHHDNGLTDASRQTKILVWATDLQSASNRAFTPNMSIIRRTIKLKCNILHEPSSPMTH